jgi:hypothetical protein
MEFTGVPFGYLDEKKPEGMSEEEEAQFLNDRLEKLLKIIHARIEEKFRDYRTAFRNIDKDFGGFLEFKEFITSFEEMGIRLKVADFKMIFDALDYDSRGVIDFNKFCFLNSDRYSLLDLQKRVSTSLIFLLINGLIIFVIENRVLSSTWKEKTTTSPALSVWEASSRPGQHVHDPAIERRGKVDPQESELELVHQ